jgi:Methyltransferase domain
LPSPQKAHGSQSPQQLPPQRLDPALPLAQTPPAQALPNDLAADRLLDRQVIEQFLRRGLGETSDLNAFWAYFVASFTRDLRRVPADEPNLTAKSLLAAYFIAALLQNFFQGEPGDFYWQPGKLRQNVFRIAQDYGLQFLPAHFYCPVPETRKLPKDIFTRCSELPGVRMNTGQQVDLLALLAGRFRSEYEAIPETKPEGSPSHTYYRGNGYYSDIDAGILYSAIRHFRPRRIIEIGSGNTTYLFAQAIARNQADDSSYRCDLIAIEPYPNAVLKAGFPGLTRLIDQPVQQVLLSEFEYLQENDILFIDSSHVLKIGSDVQYELLEIVPRLKKGVLVHLHDIFLPREYPRDWVENMNRYFTEQYLLQSFLAFNDSFEVLLAASWLHIHRPDALRAAFRSYDPAQAWTPSNFWMRRTR